MIQSGDSWYKLIGFCNTTRNWVISDTEELYRQNLIDHADQLQELGWNDTSVTYTFNSDGFRSDEFIETERDSIVFLGCSLTMGIGIPLQDTWAYKVAQSLNLRCYNLGVGGTSADGCFRLANYWLPILKPKYVCMLTPALGRMELIDNNTIHGFLPMQLTPNDMREKLERAINIILNSDQKDEYSKTQLNAFYEKWVSNSINPTLNREKNQLAIRHICQENNIKIFELTFEENAPIFNPSGFTEKSIIEKARDLIHPGKQWNVELAEKYLQMIQEKIEYE